MLEFLHKHAKNITYSQPFQLKYRDNNGVEKFINKIGNQFQEIIPLKPFLKWIKLGQGTITVVGDTQYNSTDTNATSETGFAHLNVSNSSIVLYMPFDANNNSAGITYDYANNSNDGTLINQVTFNSTGCIYGNCYTFDGVNDYINISNLPSLGNSLTILMWVKTNYADTGDGSQHHIFSAKTGTETHRLFVDTNGDLKYSDNINQVVTTDVGAWGNNWHHVAIVIQNGVASGTTIYFDGASKISGTIDFTAGGGNVEIASIGGSSFFQGNIDEVMAWNIALNATHVSEIYNNQTSRFHGTGEMLFQN